MFETLINTIPRYPVRLAKDVFLPIAYRAMVLSRQLDERLIELFRKGYAKGTVVLSMGCEATTVGMGLPFRPGIDVMALTHRDLGVQLCAGVAPYDIICQHFANANSITHGKEGNVHYGNVSQRRWPFMSHIGAMLSPAVGGVWGAKGRGEDVLGLATIGDGGTSVGDFHEAINLASVRKVPVLFVIENNEYAYSTPISLQYNCKNLSDRAAGYGIIGKTIDGTNVWEVYTEVCNALDSMRATQLPYLIESRCLRLKGHAVYDTAEYVTAEERERWQAREPMAPARKLLLELKGWNEERVAAIETEVREQLDADVSRALSVSRPSRASVSLEVYAAPAVKKVDPFSAVNVKFGNAVTLALNYILEREKNSVVVGQDIGQYGSPFKTCKGLFATFGAQRVIDMPICESATVGFCLGASQTGMRPIMEFQFSDFSTEAITQLGLNCGTWFFRSQTPAPLLFRLPCGGGITLGAFHSGEYEGLWTRFAGLKVVYPSTPQEVFEAIVAGFYDPNPVLVFEHKALYWTKGGDISFSGDLNVWQPRQYATGTEVTIVAMGAMVDIALAAVQKQNCSAEVWNPFILSPLNLEPIIASVKKTGRLLVVQESTLCGGMAEQIVGRICRACLKDLQCEPAIVSMPDVPVPFAPELELAIRPDIDAVCTALESLTRLRC